MGVNDRTFKWDLLRIGHKHQLFSVLPPDHAFTAFFHELEALEKKSGYLVPWPSFEEIDNAPALVGRITEHIFLKRERECNAIFSLKYGSKRLLDTLDENTKSLLVDELIKVLADKEAESGALKPRRFGPKPIYGDARFEEDGREVRAAILTLRDLGPVAERAAPFLMPFLNLRDTHRKPNGSFLPRSGWEKETNALMFTWENEPDGYFVAPAIEALGEMKCRDAVGKITPFLEYYSEKTYWASMTYPLALTAMNALVKIGDKRAIKPLSELSFKVLDASFDPELFSFLSPLERKDGLSFILNIVINAARARLGDPNSARSLGSEAIHSVKCTRRELARKALMEIDEEGMHSAADELFRICVEERNNPRFDPASSFGTLCLLSSDYAFEKIVDFLFYAITHGPSQFEDYEAEFKQIGNMSQHYSDCLPELVRKLHQRAYAENLSVSGIGEILRILNSSLDCTDGAVNPAGRPIRPDDMCSLRLPPPCVQLGCSYGNLS